MELITVLNKNNVVEIKGYEELQAIVDRAITESKRTGPIESNFELTKVKGDRTNIRKAKDIIATFRKETYKQYLGEFEEKCKVLERQLDSADKELKEFADTYTNKNKKPTYIITIKTEDYKFCNEIVKIVNQKGLAAKVEEK